MGGALLQGWLARGLGPVIVVEPKPVARLKKLKGVRFVDAIEDDSSGPCARLRRRAEAADPENRSGATARPSPHAARR